MNRIEFFRSINLNDRNLNDMIIGFFDQHMLLYNLVVDSVSNISILDDNFNIRFQVDFLTEDDSITFQNCVTQNPIMSIYDKAFNIDCQPINDKSMLVIMSETFITS